LGEPWVIPSLLMGLGAIGAGAYFWRRHVFQPSDFWAEPTPLPADYRARDCWREEWRLLRPALPLIIGLASFVFWLGWYAWGVEFAGDGALFLLNYLQLPQATPTYYHLQLYLPPLTGLVYGGALDLGGLPLVISLQWFQALTSAIVIYAILRPFGRFSAWFLFILWLCYFNLQAYYHLVGGDALMTWTIPFWVYSLRLALHYQRPAFYVLLGASVALNALVRSGNMALGLSFVAIFLLGLPWRAALGRFALASTILAFVMGVYSLYNGLRYEHFAPTRGGNSIWWSAVFVPESLVRPENGPASRRLAELVATHLLTTDVYAGVTLEAFFTIPSSRTWDDTLGLIDRTEGWDTEYALLREVAIEAIRAYPLEFLRYNGRDVAKMFLSRDPLRGDDTPVEEPQFVEYEFIVDRPYQGWIYSNPSGQPPDPQALAELDARLQALSAPLYADPLRTEWIRPLGWFWSRFSLHPLVAWLCLPLALWGGRGWGRAYLIGLGLGMAAVVVPAAVVILQLRYRLPFDLIYLLWVTLAVCTSLRRLTQLTADEGATVSAHHG